MKRIVGSVIVCLLVIPYAYGQEPGDDCVLVKVVDCGQGLCCVVQAPGEKYMIYDCGVNSENAMRGIRELIGDEGTVDLLVISHTDKDHIMAAKAICDDYDVTEVVRLGDRTKGKFIDPLEKAIRDERKENKCKDIDLARRKGANIDGTQFPLGPATVTVLSGYGKLPKDWLEKIKGNDSELRNAGSIVVRLTYKGHSVLFCGDEMGRHLGEDDGDPILAEKHMIESSDKEGRRLESDVMIAPHHGSDSGSTTAFIKAVKPKYVIFSAGHSSNYHHPSAVAAKRYEDAGIKVTNMFRTDLGDNEGAKEWSFGRAVIKKDTIGDDDIDIILPAHGDVQVGYAQEKSQDQHDKAAAIWRN